jgi:hypothetical protein
MMLRHATAVLALLGLAGCGGGGSSTPTTMPSGPALETFSGTASVSATGGCSNTTEHSFQSGEGTIAVTLTQSTGNAGVAVQVCHPSATAHDAQCTVPPFARIGVGEATRAPLKGGRSQVLTIYPVTCGQAGTHPAATVSYTVTVEHPR